MTNNPSFFKGDLRPVDQVNWDEAMLFCDLLTKLHLHEKLISNGFRWRLPTEAEWEYACRAGSEQAYSGDIGLAAWYLDNSGMQSHPVKVKTANNWGLHDMHGNVWEWCSDWYVSAYYGTAAASGPDPPGPAEGANRVCRGASWESHAAVCRSAVRNGDGPTFRRYSRGFRLAMNFVGIQADSGQGKVK
jgi:formylglycine-generating enzyme required for sulfatase activity